MGADRLSIPGLFDAVLELAPARRAAYLDEACRGHPEVRLQVEALLGFLDDARTDDLFPSLDGGIQRPLAMGERIGPYRILRELGAGGMGVVFLAERDDVDKRVALKLVREGGLASGDRLQRFLRERRVLARLEHPNIARLLDAGVTQTGLPYFAMEYVEGTPIDRYCDERRLVVAERLNLFRTVCDAVQHAHQNLVVHRDLKPSNIMVTSDGQVKLLDFGIAKLLGHEAGGDEAPTGMLMLTPEYASPEQVRGELVTTASDIYSLGVVLYQLLTGYRPYSLGSRSPAEIQRAVCEEKPERPSLVVTREDAGASAGGLLLPATPDAVARSRSNSPAQLRRRLRGDLDTIVLKALNKEADRRYVSAAQLSEDLRRHLVGLPVLARNDTAAYRAGKFLLRHRLGVAAAALLLLSLVAGIVATAWQARRAEAARAVAEERFRDVHDLATTVVFEIHDAIADLPGATRARALIVNWGLDYLQRLSRQSQGDRTLQRESAEAYIRLGMAQGYPSGANLGDLDGARASLDRALAIAGPLVASDPQDRKAIRTLALAHEKLGDVKAWSGDVPGAVADAREALSHWGHLAEIQPGVARPRISWAISSIKLGDLLGHPSFPNLGDRPGAERQYRRALELLETTPPDSVAGWTRRRQIALTHERLAAMLRLDGRRDEALAEFNRSLEFRVGLIREDPASSEAARDIAVTRENLCELHRERGEYSSALGHCNAAIKFYGDLHASDPGNAQALTDLAVAHSELSRVLEARGEWPAALARMRSGRELLREFLRANPGHGHAGRELGRNFLRSSMLHAHLARRSGVERGPMYRREAESLYAEGRRILGESHSRRTAAEREEDEALAREAVALLASGGGETTDQPSVSQSTR